MPVETYFNGLAQSPYQDVRELKRLEVHRSWMTPNMMIGGTIQGCKDGDHLIEDFGITAVLNVETEHTDIMNFSDLSKVKLLELPVWDHGLPILGAVFHAASQFAIDEFNTGGKLYVHCQMGRARSPSFCYAILRGQGLSAEDAMKKVQEAVPDFMNKEYRSFWRHEVYVKSVEDAFSRLIRTRFEQPVPTHNLKKGAVLMDQKGTLHDLVDFTNDGSVLLKIAGTESNPVEVGINAVQQSFLVKVDF